VTDLSNYFENRTTEGTGSPIEASVFNNWGAALQAVLAEAIAARDVAIDAAEQATAPADDTIAALVGSETSATREQMDAVFASEVDLDAARLALESSIAGLQAQAASTEDLCFSTHIQTGATTTWPNTSNQSVPLFSAPFPLVITRVAMLMWSSTGNAPLSDTSYWLVELRKHSADNVTTTLIAQKSTRLNALATGGPGSTGAVPAGTAIAARIPWVFSSAILAGVTLAAGESLSWSTYPIGSPTAMYGPVSLTIGYKPL